MHGLNTIKALNDKCKDSNSETMTVLRIMNAGHLEFNQGVMAPIQDVNITDEGAIPWTIGMPLNKPDDKATADVAPVLKSRGFPDVALNDENDGLSYNRQSPQAKSCWGKFKPE